MGSNTSLARIPSVDEVLKAASGAVAQYGRPLVVAAIRGSIEDVRASLHSDPAAAADVDEIAASAIARLAAEARPNVRPVFNLTGTVLHTNLGRALLAEAAVEAAVVAMRSNSISARESAASATR